jgi:hypothetical protein
MIGSAGMDEDFTNLQLPDGTLLYHQLNELFRKTAEKLLLGNFFSYGRRWHHVNVKIDYFSGLSYLLILLLAKNSRPFKISDLGFFFTLGVGEEQVPHFGLAIRACLVHQGNRR